MWGVEVRMTAVDSSEKQTAGPSIYSTTSLQLHLQNQSHPMLIDVRIIELSLGFSWAQPPAALQGQPVRQLLHPDIEQQGALYLL
ncbi:hypothetical protein NQZ68_005757 [Dissostichus eleginoides]|nr:hypothetical protein NQZ68_005757 [Dissostichus eleginoides]